MGKTALLRQALLFLAISTSFTSFCQPLARYLFIVTTDGLRTREVFEGAFARHYLDTQQPDVLFLSLGETDEYAHEGKYGDYLEAAHQFDQILCDLWTFIQNSDHYRDQSVILVSTDHGRSDRHWRQHLRLLKGSDTIWMAIAGHSIAPIGEIKKGPVIKQCQLAQTMAGILGTHFTTEHPVAKRIEKIFDTPQPAPALAAQKQASSLQSSLK